MIYIIINKGGKGAIATFIERTTTFLVMNTLTKSSDAEEFADKAISMLLPYKHRIHTLGAGNRSEFS